MIKGNEYANAIYTSSPQNKKENAEKINLNTDNYL